THRWTRVRRDEDELALEASEDRLLHVLFSTGLEDLGLYGKPMARNAQVWGDDFRLLLDGPTADREELRGCMHQFFAGGLFGYRFLFPAMRVGDYELYWHRPLVAFSNRKGQAHVLMDGPLGYLTAYEADKSNRASPLELWPRILARDVPAAAVELFKHYHDP